MNEIIEPLHFPSDPVCNYEKLMSRCGQGRRNQSFAPFTPGQSSFGDYVLFLLAGASFVENRLTELFCGAVEEGYVMEGVF